MSKPGTRRQSTTVPGVAVVSNDEGSSAVVLNASDTIPTATEEKDTQVNNVPDAASEYDEITIEVPRRGGGREKQVNPHAAGIERVIALKGTGRGLATRPMPNEDVKKNLTWLRRGGNEKKVTIRTIVHKVDDNTSKIEFWAVDQVKRPRREKPASPAPTSVPSPDATPDVTNAADSEK